MIDIKAVNRKNTNCSKWDTIIANGYPEDTLCMWVADMEFATLPEIKRAIIDRAQHAIYGYSKLPEDYYDVVCSWMKRRHSIKAHSEWIITAPGNVSALKMAIQTFTNPNDAILIQTPVYYQFKNSIETNKRVVVTSPLILKNGRYEINFADFETKIIKNNVRLFIFCNPHNPVCRVFSEWETRRLADICIRHDVMLIADEVHADFVFEPARFVSVLTLGESYLKNTLVCTGVNKTFNIAGLKNANVFLPNPLLREKFFNQLVCYGIEKQNLFGSIACRAAYLYGDEYVDELINVIRSNFEFLQNCIAELMPCFKIIKPEGTCLAWIDISALGLENAELHDFFCNDARLWVDEGFMFGPEGEGYIRLNIACLQRQIREAILRIKNAVKRKTKGK